MSIPFKEDADPHLWLENINDSKVVNWASIRNIETRHVLSPFSDVLKNKILRYYKIPLAISLEASQKGVFSLFREDGSYKVKLIDSDGAVQELIDSKSLGEDILIKNVNPNKNGDIFALNYSRAGSDNGFTDIVETNSGYILDKLEGVVNDITWIDKNQYYYVRSYRDILTPDGIKPPASRIFLRENGEEEMVYGKGIPQSHWLGLKKSENNEKALLILSYGWHKSSVITGKLRFPDSWEKIYGGEDFVTFPVDFINGEYYVASYDRNGFGRIISIDQSRKIKEIIKENQEPLQSIVALKRSLIASYMVNATSFIRWYDLEGNLIKKYEFDSPGTISSLTTNDSDCFFRFQSFTTPYKIYLHNNEGLRILSAQDVFEHFSIEDIWTNSQDGTLIHSFMVRKRDIAPTKILLYGYGGFSISLTPAYVPNLIPFLEDGGTFIQTNLRGGSEAGEEWHRAGMREKKQNVFNDFISVIKFVRDLDAKVVIQGRSNGGLLVGTTLTQNPDMLDGAVIGYPVLDMRRFHKLLIGHAWVPEYGNPDDPNDAKYLSKYSPYHNIDELKEYPPILLYTGLNDDRVHPAHALKFAAVLEETGKDYLLRMEEKSGHAGATPETKIEEEADILAFIYHSLGMKVK
jgi:prolyl oligopeptidase